MKCPDCGTPLDEIPFESCEYHKAHLLDEEEAYERKKKSREDRVFESFMSDTEEERWREIFDSIRKMGGLRNYG